MSSTSEEDGNLVVIVVDVNPKWWGLARYKLKSSELSLTDCFQHVMVFVNSHLMMNHKNKVAVIASHTNESRFLYPRKAPVTENGFSEHSPQGSSDGKYEQFAIVNDQMKQELQALVAQNSSFTHTDTLMSGSLAMALCYIQKIVKQCPVGERLQSRILVIQAASDSASQYMNFMNVIFTAQKQNIPIDACVLDKESGLMQQACDITGGIYLKIPEVSGLLQYLLWVFLPPPSLRDKLVLPPSIHVDYRAACFCHRILIDVGYVCSVCLSIFCAYSPICSTCHTAFKIKAAPLKAKKKKKTTANAL